MNSNETGFIPKQVFSDVGYVIIAVKTVFQSNILEFVGSAAYIYTGHKIYGAPQKIQYLPAKKYAGGNYVYNNEIVR